MICKSNTVDKRIAKKRQEERRQEFIEEKYSWKRRERAKEGGRKSR